MSFYDSASLAFLPSGGAGKDGKAYSIKPVPEYGNELITNGGFDTDSDWTKTNATISGGVATITSTGYAYAAVVQNNVLTIGKTYKATFDINSIVGGLRVATSQVITNSGIASVTFTATNTYFDIRRDSSFATTTAVIDNVSVKEVIVDGDFDFSRGSNLTATRVDSNGLIEKGRENLLLQSNQFDTTWTTSNASVTSGQSGYDGSNDAWLLEATGTSSTRVQQTISTDSVQTISVYAKKGTSDYFQIRLTGSTTAFAFFDLANGTLGILSNQVDADITSVGNGWYRCSLVRTGAATSARIYVTGNNTTSVSVGDNIYIQDAQLEQGLVATEYIESGATTGKAGLLEDSPRFDYSGGASCPSLLLEPSRTNLIEYSEYFEDSSWVKESGATIESNVDSSPDGNTNASYLKAPIATNSTIRIKYTFSSTSSQTYVGSIFVKKENVDFIRILSTGATASTLQAFYNVSNGTLGSSGTPSKAKIEDYGNGWYRLSLIIDAVNTSSSATFRVQLAKTDGAVIDNFDGTEKNLIFGAQLEQASYPTSYIPNHSGGSVTRGKDESKVTDLISNEITTSNKFTYFVELEGLGRETNPQLYLNDLSNNRILSLNIITQKNRYGFYSPDASNYISSSSNEGNGVVKIAVTYDGTNFKEFFNGVNTGTLSASVSNLLNEIDLNYSNVNAIAIHKNLLFPTALSNTDCEILTGTSYESFAAMATALNYTTYE